MRRELAVQAALLGATKDSQWQAGSWMTDVLVRSSSQECGLIGGSNSSLAVPGSPDGHLFLAADEGHYQIVSSVFSNRLTLKSLFGAKV